MPVVYIEQDGCIIRQQIDGVNPTCLLYLQPRKVGSDRTATTSSSAKKFPTSKPALPEADTQPAAETGNSPVPVADPGVASPRAEAFQVVLKLQKGGVGLCWAAFTHQEWPEQVDRRREYCVVPTRHPQNAAHPGSSRARPTARHSRTTSRRRPTGRRHHARTVHCPALVRKGSRAKSLRTRVGAKAVVGQQVPQLGERPVQSKLTSSCWSNLPTSGIAAALSSTWRNCTPSTA